MLSLGKRKQREEHDEEKEKVGNDSSFQGEKIQDPHSGAYDCYVLAEDTIVGITSTYIDDFSSFGAEEFLQQQKLQLQQQKQQLQQQPHHLQQIHYPQQPHYQQQPQQHFVGEDERERKRRKTEEEDLEDAFERYVLYGDEEKEKEREHLRNEKENEKEKEKEEEEKGKESEMEDEDLGGFFLSAMPIDDVLRTVQGYPTLSLFMGCLLARQI